MGIGVAIGSIAVEASVIEKHFTLSPADGGVDSTFSLDPDEVNDLIIESKQAWLSIGLITYGPTEAEKRI